MNYIITLKIFNNDNKLVQTTIRKFCTFDLALQCWEALICLPMSPKSNVYYKVSTSKGFMNELNKREQAYYKML